MTVTLYKNSQHEADTPELIYKDHWSVLPYESSNMFCSGETTDKNDFILPADITYTADGFRYQVKSSCILSTNDKGQPVLTLESNRAASYILLTEEERRQAALASPATSAKKEKPVWVPGYDKNGELEIF